MNTQDKPKLKLRVQPSTSLVRPVINWEEADKSVLKTGLNVSQFLR